MNYYTVNEPSTVINTINNTQNSHFTTVNINKIYINPNVISNQVQNNNPPLEETSKFLEKIKPTKNKVLSAFGTIILGVSTNQITPQINDINLVYKSIFWSVVAFIAYFFSS